MVRNATFHLAALLVCVVACVTLPLRPVRADDVDLQTERSGLSIVESGSDATNNRVFSIQADRVEITEVLKALFRKLNAEVAIDQDVSGPVTLSIRNVPFREALQWIVQVARPQIKITKSGAVYHVQRDLVTQREMLELQHRVQALTGGSGAWPAVPTDIAPGLRPHVLGSQPPVPGVPNRFVTLDVPADKAIPLADAVARISAQARYAVALDPRVPRELRFTGTITQAPLPLVLSEIAETSGLKLVANSAGATFFPTDQFTVRVNELLLSQYPGGPCSHCGEWVSAAWNYCPNCGQITPHGLQIQRHGGKRPE